MDKYRFNPGGLSILIFWMQQTMAGILHLPGVTITMRMNFLPAIFLILSFALSISTGAQTIRGAMGEVFTTRVVADHLADPWEVTYGPDGYLWVTEAKGYKVSRINPQTGVKSVLLDLSANRNFPRYDKIPDSIDGGKSWPQGGLMGLALHPGLLTGKPFVYLSYIHSFKGAKDTGNGCAVNFGGCFYTARIVRYEYRANVQQLVNPVTLCDTLPASNDHNAGRLMIAPVNGPGFLFYSVGDLGAGQFDNGGRPNHAQQVDVYEGKILRFNTEPDTDAGLYDRWIPNDNPFNRMRQNAVWSYGHRNPQGLAYAVVGQGRIYSSEHGPFSDDEINIIEKGKNYGHPLVIGYNDNNYNGLAAAASDHEKLPGPWHTTYPLIIREDSNAARIGAGNYRDPIKTFYPSSNAYLTAILNRIVQSDTNKPTWVSEAPSGLDVYTSSAIPGWKNSLLMPTLKGGKLIRLKLNAAGDKVTGDTICYFKGPVRYRDIAISPDGTRLYLSSDSAAVSSGPSEENPSRIAYKGAIIEFTYQAGTGNAANTNQRDSRDKSLPLPLETGVETADNKTLKQR